MYIKLIDVANSIGVNYSTFQHFVSGARRSELMCRRLGENVGLPWQRMQQMRAEDVEAVLVYAYLEKSYSCIQDIKKSASGYENKAQECA